MNFTVELVGPLIFGMGVLAVLVLVGIVIKMEDDDGRK